MEHTEYRFLYKQLDELKYCARVLPYFTSKLILKPILRPPTMHLLTYHNIIICIIIVNLHLQTKKLDMQLNTSVKKIHKHRTL